MCILLSLGYRPMSLSLFFPPLILTHWRIWPISIRNIPQYRTVVVRSRQHVCAMREGDKCLITSRVKYIIWKVFSPQILTNTHNSCVYANLMRITIKAIFRSFCTLFKVLFKYTCKFWLNWSEFRQNKVDLE